MSRGSLHLVWGGRVPRSLSICSGLNHNTPCYVIIWPEDSMVEHPMLSFDWLLPLHIDYCEPHDLEYAKILGYSKSHRSLGSIQRYDAFPSPPFHPLSPPILHSTHSFRVPSSPSPPLPLSSQVLLSDNQRHGKSRTDTEGGWVWEGFSVQSRLL